MLLRLVPTFVLRRQILRLAGGVVASNATPHRGLRLFGFGGLICGADSTINRNVYLDCRKGITIGANVSVSHDCRLYTLGHDVDDENFRAVGAPVTIADHAVLFAGAVVMPGVTIGRGAVVYPFALVTKDIPAGEVWGGSPARRIRQRELDEIHYSATYDQWLGN